MASLQIQLVASLIFLLILLSWTVQGQPKTTFDLVVAKDGSGNYSTIMDAIAAAPKLSSRKFIIKIEKGIYTENVLVEDDKTNIIFIGDGIDKTIISGSRSAGGGYKTYKTATLGIRGDGFMAIDITIENTAGATNKQAVALRSSARSVFYRCKFSGYQDTLYTHQNKQFYRQCEIYGTIDFIFGDATVVLQNCAIYARLPPKGESNTITITAQGRNKSTANTGIVIQNCTITAADDLKRSGSSLIKSYLGRPWKEYSTTIVMQSFIDNIIDPAGWLEWENNKTNLATIFYAEYGNRGPGAATNRRVKWNSYHKINRREAMKFTVRNFISGNEWLPSLGIPFFLDLM